MANENAEPCSNSLDKKSQCSLWYLVNGLFLCHYPPKEQCTEYLHERIEGVLSTFNDQKERRYYIAE